MDIQGTMATNPLYAWLIDQGFWIASGQDRNCTHVFLDGGKACVSDRAGFHAAYARAIRQGMTQYAVEQRTPVFRLFVDVDIQDKGPVDDAMIDKICAKIYEASRSFFFPTQSSMVACRAPVRPMSDGVRWKNGVHCHWPDVYVTASKALSFRSFCVNEVEKEFGSGCFVNSWNDILDAAVFRSSGLRMIGSSKKNTPGTYLPAAVFESTGTVVRVPQGTVMDNFEHWIELTSIRVEHPRDTAPHAQGDSTDEAFESRVIQGDHSGSIRRVKFSDVDGVLADFAKVLPAFYRNAKVTSVYEIKSSASAKTKKFVLGTNSKNCMNKTNGVHRSNHVYFMLEPRGVFQKCFCRCDTLEGRRYKHCRDFCGKVANLTPAMAAAVGTSAGGGHADRPRDIGSVASKILSAYK
jgi:hypothetical protein